MELKDRELKEREGKIKREVIISKSDMDKFEEQEVKKIRPIIRHLFDKSIKQNMMRSKPKIIRENLKDKIIRDKLKDKIATDIWTLFETEEEKKERKELEKKKENNEKLIRDGIIRDIRTFLEQEEDYYEPRSK